MKKKIKSQLIKQIQQYKCLINHPAKYFCCNQQCQQIAFICNNQKCQCINQKHIDCPKVFIQNFIKQIISKYQPLTKELERSFDIIDEFYIQMIEKLSQERQQLALIKENYGLGYNQAQFMDIIKNKKWELVKGKNIFKIKDKIKENNILSGLTQKNVIQFWQKNEKKFQKITKRLKQAYVDKNCLKDIIFSWDKKCQIQDKCVVNGSIVRKKSNSFNDRSDILLQPAVSNKKSCLFGIHIQKGNYFSIGLIESSRAVSFNYNQYQSTKSRYQIKHDGTTIQNNCIMRRNSFDFTQKDTIYILYDPYEKTLKFNKNINDGFVIMKNIKSSSSTILNFYINSLNQTIESQAKLINYDQVPNQINWNLQKSKFISPVQILRIFEPVERIVEMPVERIVEIPRIRQY